MARAYHNYIKVIFPCSLLILLAICHFKNFNFVQKSTNLLRKSRSLAYSNTDIVTIPRTLWVDDKPDKISDKNIQKLVHKYKNALGDENIQVQKLTKATCKDAISKIPIDVVASDELFKFFVLEDRENYICRIAVLFLFGGYSFQKDVDIIQPYIAPNSDISFIGVAGTNNGMFDGSFIASRPNHKLLYHALQKYVLLAKGQLQLEGSGSFESSPQSKFSEIMRASYLEVFHEYPNSKDTMVMLYAEHLDDLKQYNEYKYIRKQDGKGKYCNFVTVDNYTKKAYFYALFPGVNPFLCDKVLPSIPRKLWFASKHELSTLAESNKKHHDNIQNTIKAYKKAWGDDDIEYEILDYKACMSLIVDFHSSILLKSYMQGFKYHANEGFDICRAVVLFQHGGYFFNDEVKVVEAYLPDKDKTFVGVIKLSGSFLSLFIASAPNNPIISDIVSKYIMIAEGKLSLITAHAAAEIHLDSYVGQDEDTLSKSDLLVEKHLTEIDEEYDAKSKKTYVCNFLISDPRSKKAQFFSKIFAFDEECNDAET